MSILRNGNVVIFLISMSILKLPKVACRIKGKAPVMSLKKNPMSLGFMSHVDYKKWLCHPVDFKGQGPYWSKF